MHLLGQIKLVGSLHILYHGPSPDPNNQHLTVGGSIHNSALGMGNAGSGVTLNTSHHLESCKIKYHGIFLYQTHLFVVKVKQATVYEP